MRGVEVTAPLKATERNPYSTSVSKPTFDQIKHGLCGKQRSNGAMMMGGSLDDENLSFIVERLIM